MNIQPYMIDVEYDERIEYFDGKHAAIKQITKATPLKRGERQNGIDVWYTYNHYRKEIKQTRGIKRKMLQIGFQLKHDEKINPQHIDVFLQPLHDQAKPIPLDYDAKDNIWFEKIKYRIKLDPESRKKSLVRNRVALTGIVDAGTIKLVVQENERTIQQAYINFLPSSFSEEDYDRMITDLFRINESLFKGRSNVAIGNKKVSTIDKLTNIIDQLDGPIRAINNRPQAALSFHWQKDKYNRQTKFRMRTEIEQRMNPGKNKVSIFKATESTQIEENQIIKNELIRLKENCIFHSQSSLTDTDKEQIKRETAMNISNLPKHLKEKLKKDKILTSNNEVNTNRLESYYSAQEEMRNDIKQKMTEMIESYKKKDQKVTKPDTAVAIRLSTILHKPLINSNITYNNETNTFHSSYNSHYNWDENFSSWKFNGYEYAGGSIPKRFSKFVTVDTTTTDLITHWKLAHLINEALLKAKEANSPIELVIEGSVIDTDPRRNHDQDIIGIPKASSSLRDFTFNFAELTSATIDGNEVDFTSVNSNAIDQFITRYLTKNNPQFSKYDADLETINHILHVTKQFANFHHKYREKSNIAQQLEHLVQIIDDWLQLPVFQSIQTTGRERLKATQLFLHDPQYLLIWTLLRDIEESMDLSLIPEFGELRYGVKKVHEIYEVWILYKMIDLLTNEMGWAIESKQNAQQYFLNFISLRKTTKNFKVTLTQKDWKLIVSYEPEINLLTGSYYTPDYVFQFFYRDRPVGNSYMDAKYRNYFEQGMSDTIKNTEANAEEIWKNDIDETAIRKYGNIKAIEEKWKQKPLSSFIIHSDAIFGSKKEGQGENYYVYYNNELYPNMITGDPEVTHKYGSIYMTPTYTFPFKNWFRMVMEFRLEKYNYCWSCGSDCVDEEIKYTRAGYEKFYYTCRSCQQFWIKSHCENGHPFIKRINTYHRLKSKTELWHIECPTCRNTLKRDKVQEKVKNELDLGALLAESLEP